MCKTIHKCASVRGTQRHRRFTSLGGARHWTHFVLAYNIQASERESVQMRALARRNIASRRASAHAFNATMFIVLCPGIIRHCERRTHARNSKYMCAAQARIMRWYTSTKFYSVLNIYTHFDGIIRLPLFWITFGGSKQQEAAKTRAFARKSKWNDNSASWARTHVCDNITTHTHTHSRQRGVLWQIEWASGVQHVAA